MAMLREQIGILTDVATALFLSAQRAYSSGECSASTLKVKGAYSSAVVRIREALIFAAREQQVVRYRDFHAFFGGAGTLRKRFELLDRIVRELADPADADYGSLMANSQRLPGPEFLRRYRVLHADEYETRAE